jgi:hypothetical protein
MTNNLLNGNSSQCYLSPNVKPSNASLYIYCPRICGAELAWKERLSTVSYPVALQSMAASWVYLSSSMYDQISDERPRPRESLLV